MELMKLEKVEAVQVGPVLASAVQKRDTLIANSSAVTIVSNDDQQEAAVDHMRRIKAMLNNTEDARKTVKAPVLNLGKRIDDIAKTFCERLTGELDRLTKLVGGYQEKQRKLIAQQEAARAAEVARLAHEEDEARKRLAKAEKAAARPSAGLSEVEAAAVAEHDLFEAARQTAVVAAAPPAEVTRTSGMVQRTVVEFEITDHAKLYALRPHWFELVPKRAVIRAEITKDTRLDGLRVWEETKVGVRE